MAQFYGTVEGKAGQASRLGSKASGMESRTMSYAGQVIVEMTHRNGIDWCRVMGADHGQSTGTNVLYDGPASALSGKQPVADRGVV